MDNLQISIIVTVLIIIIIFVYKHLSVEHFDEFGEGQYSVTAPYNLRQYINPPVSTLSKYGDQKARNAADFMERRDAQGTSGIVQLNDTEVYKRAVKAYPYWNVAEDDIMNENRMSTERIEEGQLYTVTAGRQGILEDLPFYPKPGVEQPTLTEPILAPKYTKEMNQRRASTRWTDNYDNYAEIGYGMDLKSPQGLTYTTPPKGVPQVDLLNASSAAGIVNSITNIPPFVKSGMVPISVY